MPELLESKLSEMNIPADKVYFSNPDYAEAIIGYDIVNERIVYDYDSMIQCLMRDGMSEDEAIEWIDYNVVGVLAAENTNMPLVVHKLW